MIKPSGTLNERYLIRAVERALVLLEAFLGGESELAAGEISKKIALDPSTTFRMLVTLEAHGFVRQDATTGKYRLGVICLELGSQFLKNNDARRTALGVMQDLRDEFGETVHLGTLDGHDIVYLEKLQGLHAIGLMSSRVGGRTSAHSTAIGKVLLAFMPEGELAALVPNWKLERVTEGTITDWKAFRKELDRVRANGYAIDNQENEAGVKCIAIPILTHKGVAAALSISGPVERMDEHIKKHKLIETMEKARNGVSKEIGGGRGVDQIGRSPAPGLSLNKRAEKKSGPAKTIQVARSQRF